MRRILNGTGFYRLTGESSADWEVNACGDGLDALEKGMEALLQDVFAATSSGERLDQWEQGLRPQSSTGTLPERRLMQTRRLAVNPRGFTPEGVSAALPAAGIVGELLETETGLRVVLGKFLGVGEGEALRELDLLLPAHLPWELDRSVTWTALDAAGKTFAEWETAGMNWEAWDSLTREQLENINGEAG